MSYFNIDPTRPVEELLGNVRRAATEQTNVPGLALTPFATLLVRLSQDASLTADKNLRIQHRMIVITCLVLAITIAQFGFAVYQYVGRDSGFIAYCAE